MNFPKAVLKFHVRIKGRVKGYWEAYCIFFGTHSVTGRRKGSILRTYVCRVFSKPLVLGSSPNRIVILSPVFKLCPNYKKNGKCFCSHWDSNPGPTVCKIVKLPTAPQKQWPEKPKIQEFFGGILPNIVKELKVQIFILQLFQFDYQISLEYYWGTKIGFWSKKAVPDWSPTPVLDETTVA